MSGPTLTRIRNNQIQDSGIWANAKIIPGSIVGSLFNSNITVTSDFTITGNLTVQGSSTYLTVASTNTYVNDPLIVLNNAFTGSNSYDLGFIFNRGSSPNKSFYWDESSGEFRLITTTETGTTYGSIADPTNYEKLHLGNLVADYDVSTKTITATGLINTTANISAAVLNAGAINSTGLINTTGNVSAAVHTGGAVSVTGLINTTGNISAAVINTGALNSTGFVNISGNISAAVSIAGSYNTTGNLLATGAVLNALTVNGTGAFTTLTATGNIIAGQAQFAAINATAIGNSSASTGKFTTLTSTDLTTGRVPFTTTSGQLIDNAGLTFSANTLTAGGAKPVAINGTTGAIGTTLANLILNTNYYVDLNSKQISNLLDPTSLQDAATKSYVDSQLSAYDATQIIVGDTEVTITDTGTDGTITAKADGATVAVITSSLTDFKILTKVSDTTGSTSTTTGAFQVVGGVGIGGNITVGGNIKATDVTQSTSTTTGAIITAGGVGIAKNLYVGGAALITGNLTVQGVLTAIQSTTLDITDAQLTLAKGAGSSAAADGAGINIDYQNVGANITYTHATGSWNFNRPIIGNSYANFGGNVLGAGFIGQSLNVSGNVLAASAVLGTLTVNGTVTNQGVNAAGNILAQGGIFNALTVNGNETVTGALAVAGNVIGGLGQFAAINATPIGNASASTGAFTTLSASGVTTLTGNLSLSGSSNIIAGGTAGTSGQVLQATGTGVSWVTLGAVSNKIYQNGSNVTVETSYVNVAVNGTNVATFSSTGLNGAAVGASTASSGRFTTLTASSTVTLSNYTGYVYANGGSAITAATTIPNTDITGLGTMSTQNSNGVTITGGSVDGTTIGSSTASSGKFTTLEATQTGLFNSAQGTNTFTIKGVSDAALFLAIPSATGGQDSIIINGQGNTTPSYGATKIGGTGAIQIPFGSTAQRPGSNGNVDLVGMVRFNTTSNNLEFCTASGSPGTYSAAGSVFTTITTNAFSGNGVQTVFTLSSASTTSGTVVMVNGVVQIPTTAYSVSGTSLTFTEAPATGDSIDARVLITTATVSQLASGNGYDSFDVSSDTYANITAGTSSSTVRVSVDGATGKVTFTNDVLINGSLTVLGDSNGNINIGDQTGDRLQLRGKTVYDQTALQAPNTNLLLLDSFSSSAYTTARYTLSVKNGSSVSSSEIILVQDATTSTIATYAVVGTLPGTFQSNISSGTVRLFYTPTGAQNANIKVLTTYIV